MVKNNLRTVRLTEPKEDWYTYPTLTEKVIYDLLHLYFDQEKPFLVVRETGRNDDNPHYHIAGSLLQTLPGSETKSDNGRTEFLRKRVNALGWKGNECQRWGIGKPDLMDSHFDYLCKGKGSGKEDGPHVIFRHPDFTQSVIEDRHKVYWKINAALPQKGRKKRKLNVSEEILTMCREREISSTEHDKIFDQVLAYYCKHVKYLQPNYVKNLVHQTSIYLNPQGNTSECLRTFCLNNYPN